MKLNYRAKWIVLLLSGILSFTEISSAQNASPKIDAIRTVLPTIDKMFQDFADKNHLPGLIYGLVVDGKLIHTFNLGYSDLDKKIPVTAQSCFRIGSMSKSFTALAILKLRDEGKLKLDDPAYMYIPQMRVLKYLDTDAPHITVRHLLTHTAGFPEDNPWGDRQLAITNKEMIDLIEKGVSFSNNPGSAFEYSNLGYALLGYIITKVSGEPYQKYITSKILVPLGMHDTYFDYRDIPSGQLVNGYKWMNGSWKQEELLKDGAFGAIGGLISSINDLSKYVSFQLSAWSVSSDIAGPVKKSSLMEMQRPSSIAFFVPKYRYLSGRPCPIVVGYGYGVSEVIDCDQKIMRGHSGGLPGFGSDWLSLPEYGIGIISFSNLTYAAVYRMNLSALDTLVTLSKIQPRQLPASAILNQRKDELIALLPNWSEAKSSGIFADNFFLDYAIDSLRKESIEIFNRSGKILNIKELIPVNNLRGSFVLEGQNSLIRIFFTLTPQYPPLIQEFRISEQKKLE